MLYGTTPWPDVRTPQQLAAAHKLPINYPPAPALSQACALLLRRLLQRGITSGRSDDNEAVIRNRLREYDQKTRPVLQFYRDRGIYAELDGTKTIEAVRGDIKGIVREEYSKRLFNVVLFGYPGSGRGSQGRALAKKSFKDDNKVFVLFSPFQGEY